ncbi:MAG: hypothetical protein IPJ52_06690 [Rhodocyclaceae bacterium]|nr:hypothetical protein [Rhodocyclaceae bacterium]
MKTQLEAFPDYIERIRRLGIGNAVDGGRDWLDLVLGETPGDFLKLSLLLG